MTYASPSPRTRRQRLKGALKVLGTLTTSYPHGYTVKRRNFRLNVVLTSVLVASLGTQVVIRLVYQTNLNSMDGGALTNKIEKRTNILCVWVL